MLGPEIPAQHFLYVKKRVSKTLKVASLELVECAPTVDVVDHARMRAISITGLDGSDEITVRAIKFTDDVFALEHACPNIRGEYPIPEHVEGFFEMCVVDDLDN